MASHCGWDMFLIINQVYNTYTIHSAGASLVLAVVAKTALTIRLFTIPWVCQANSGHISLHSSGWVAFLLHLCMAGSFSSFRFHPKCESSLTAPLEEAFPALTSQALFISFPCWLFSTALDTDWTFQSSSYLMQQHLVKLIFLPFGHTSFTG